MIQLVTVSLIWSVSFGLVKGNLAGIDPVFSAAVRLLIALAVFLPFLRVRGIDRRTAVRLAGIGAVQYGAMYIAYFLAFRFLAAYEVALFTIFTPIYVTLLNDGAARRLSPRNLMTALLAVAGTAIVVFRDLGNDGLLIGFLVVQASNLCFAFGQIAYRQVMPAGLGDRQVFALLYLGAVLLTVPAALLHGGAAIPVLTPTQVLTYLYLGSLASGLCFFLWNAGARRVEGGTLAIINNLKVPLAVAASLLLFGESADPIRLLAGGLVVLGALIYNGWDNRRSRSVPRQPFSEESRS